MTDALARRFAAALEGGGGQAVICGGPAEAAQRLEEIVTGRPAAAVDHPVHGPLRVSVLLYPD